MLVHGLRELRLGRLLRSALELSLTRGLWRPCAIKISPLQKYGRTQLDSKTYRAYTLTIAPSSSLCTCIYDALMRIGQRVGIWMSVLRLQHTTFECRLPIGSDRLQYWDIKAQVPHLVQPLFLQLLLTVYGFCDRRRHLARLVVGASKQSKGAN